MTDLAKSNVTAGPDSTGPEPTPASGDGSPTSAPRVEIRGVSRVFVNRDGDERQALSGVDLSVPSGQFLAVIGASGCGKSTLLRLLGGLDQPTSGTLAIDGDDPQTVRGRGVIGLVPQSPALLPWKSVSDNVALLGTLNSSAGGRLSDDQVRLWLERVQLGADGDLLPHQLSGGMQQRVALARAFAIQPSLLLMDEPFTALDEITRHDMQALLLDLWRLTTSTVVFVTHSIDEAVKLADRVVVMHGGPGRIAADFPIDLDRPRARGIEDEPRFRRHAANLRRALIDSVDQPGGTNSGGDTFGVVDRPGVDGEAAG